MSNRKTSPAPKSRKLLSTLITLAVLLLAAFGVIDLPEGGVAPQAPAAPTAQAVQTAADQDEGPITAPQAIADYIFLHGKLPDNFITKQEAREMGWDSERNDVSDVAPGYSIGGDRFGNYEGLLPSKKGRTWYEADCNYKRGNRGAERIVYSSDGLVYYTKDHYESFTEMKPSGQ